MGVAGLKAWLRLTGVLSGLGLGAPEADDVGVSTVARGEEVADKGGGIPLWVVVLVVLIILIVIAVVASVIVLRLRSRETAVPAARRVARRPRQGARMRVPRMSHGIPQTQSPVFHTIPVGNVEGGLANIGKLHGQGQRPQQQDSFGVSDSGMDDPKGQLLVVCDGMGGLSNGDAVSAAAVEAVLDQFMLQQEATDAINELLLLAVAANSAVNDLLGPDGIKQSGSTLVMALIRDGYLSFLSIGDSRICLLRNGELLQLNREHEYEKELVMRAINGDMLLYDALTDPQGKALMSYLGMGELRDVDYPSRLLKLHANDVIVLMSDGVYNALTDEEIIGALQDVHPVEAASTLGSIIEGKAFENQDNYTAVIVRYDGI